MFEKNKLKKLLIAALLFAGACSFAPAPETGLPTDSIIDTSPVAQAEFRRQWLATVGTNVFEGRGKADVYGGGPSSFFDVFAFDAEGNLHDAGTPSTFGWYSLHRVVAFKSSTQAVVMFYKAATGDGAMQGQVYALEIRGGKIYRTQNVIKSDKNRAMGFSSYADWDKASYSDAKLEEFASLDRAVPYPTLKVPAPNS